MRRISLPELEIIGALILELPAIFDAYACGSTSFRIDALNWLKRVEKALQQNTMLSAGGISALRGELVACEDGILPPDILQAEKTPRRKHKNALVAKVLKEAEALVNQAIADDGVRVKDSMNLAYQIVVHGARKGLLDSQDIPIGEAAWKRLGADYELLSLLVHMESLMGKQDCKLLLSRTLAASLQS